MDRRSFFSTGIRQLQKFVQENVLSEEILPSEMLFSKNRQTDYFESPLTCYPLLSEVPYEFLVKAAKEKGIPIDNKSKFELAKAIFDERESL